MTRCWRCHSKDLSFQRRQQARQLIEKRNALRTQQLKIISNRSRLNLRHQVQYVYRWERNQFVSKRALKEDMIRSWHSTAILRIETPQKMKWEVPFQADPIPHTGPFANIYLSPRGYETELRIFEDFFHSVAIFESRNEMRICSLECSACNVVWLGKNIGNVRDWFGVGICEDCKASSHVWEFVVVDLMQQWIDDGWLLFFIIVYVHHIPMKNKIDCVMTSYSSLTFTRHLLRPHR